MIHTAYHFRIITFLRRKLWRLTMYRSICRVWKTFYSVLSDLLCFVCLASGWKDVQIDSRKHSNGELTVCFPKHARKRAWKEGAREHLYQSSPMMRLTSFAHSLLACLGQPVVHSTASFKWFKHNANNGSSGARCAVNILVWAQLRSGVEVKILKWDSANLPNRISLSFPDTST